MTKDKGQGVLNQEALAAIALASRQSFLYEEAPDHLATLEKGIEQLRQGGQEYTPIIRAAHSLKGGAGLASMPELSRLAHKLEDLLIALRFGRVAARETADKLLSQTLDRIAEQLLAAMSNQNVPGGTQKVEATTAALEAFLAELPTATDAELEPVASSSFQQPSFYKTALTEDLEECLQRLEADMTDAAAVASFVEEATLLGETLGLTWLQELAAEMGTAVGQELPEAAVSEIISRIRTSRREFLNGTTPSPPPDTTPPPPELFTNPVSEERNSVGNETSTSETGLPIPQRFLKYLILQPQAAPIPGLLQVRVPLTRLEEMGDRAAELLAQCQRLQNTTNPDIPPAIAAIRSGLEALSTDITNLRLVPFRQIADRYHTPLDSLKQKYHKQVQLRVQDPENLVDQVILEQLQAPLTHLFRNAFDHGIELPVERKVLGKPPIATITLTATTRRSHLEITITDDGRGIDIETVYQRAVEKGLIPRNRVSEETNSVANQKSSSETRSLPQLPTEEILKFLFTPGFSTAKQVTDLSGRGVGLDVVLSQVSRLGGSLELATNPGYGTKFIITVPLTQTVLPLYFFHCGGASLALPSSDIIDILDMSDTTDSPEEIIWKNQSLPLFNLANILPYGRQARRLIPASAAQSPETGFLSSSLFSSEVLHRNPVSIIIDIGQKVALLVDNISAKLSAAVKPFDATLTVPAWLEGWTLGSSGEVVPVLSGASLAEIIPLTTVPAQPTILVVDDSLALRRTLEMLLSQAGFAVVTCNDGREALAALTENAARFNLVISDLEMPHLDGFGLLAAIKNHPTWRRLPVAMLTSQNTPYHRRRALELGAAVYITKPFEPAAILASLSGLGLPKISDIIA